MSIKLSYSRNVKTLNGLPLSVDMANTKVTQTTTSGRPAALVATVGDKKLHVVLFDATSGFVREVTC
jgi:hypothetical protein